MVTEIRQQISWVAVDWGTTHLRVYAVAADDQVLAEAHSAKGMGVLSADDFEPALLELIGGWLPEQGTIPVLACGMVGARQGWQEATYQTVPCRPLATENLLKVTTTDLRIAVFIVPGVCQMNPADVMRGEETQIAGLLATQITQIADPNALTTVCLPGTHSKWVEVQGGNIIRFSTFMTGEIFALLCQHSILRYEMTAAEWDDDAFLAGVNQAIENPSEWSNDCFRIRASGLLGQLEAGSARARLSGLLIGGELAGAAPYWQGRTVALIGEEPLSALYAQALHHLNINTTKYDPGMMTLAGLRHVHRVLSGDTA